MSSRLLDAEPDPRSRTMTGGDGVALIVIALFVAVAAWLVRDAVGVPSIIWMDIYRAADFPDLGSIAAFLVGTRLPLPPLLTLAELLNHEWDGTTWLVTVALYRFCLVAAFALALWRARRPPLRLLIALALALVFLAATVVIHAAGPWVYDFLLPSLLLAFFLLLDRLRPGSGGVPSALFAGSCLALAELTRPFVIALLPLLLLGAALRLRRLPARTRIAFFLPVLLLSGGWHLHQYLSFGQIAWSNHGGYNLLNAWPMIEVPPLAPEPDRPVVEGRAPNLDSAAHGENSRRIVGAMLAYVAGHPVDSAVHVVERIAQLLSAPTAYVNRYPQHGIFPVYQVAARYAGLYLLLAAGIVLAAMLLRPSRLGALLAETDNLLLLTAAGMIVLIAIGDHGEEARFLLSVLPLAVAVPLPRLDPAHQHKIATAWRHRRLAAGLAAALIVAAVEIVVAGSERQPTGAAEGRFPTFVTAASALGGDSVRVLALNIRGRHWHDPAAAAGIVQRCLDRADVAGLLEAAGGYGWSEGQAERLARDAGMNAVFAPAERRWWHDQTGSAVLARLPGAQWRRIPLPRQNGLGYRALLVAQLAWGTQQLSVLTGQLDTVDVAVQFAATKALFDSLPLPAVMILDVVGPALARIALPALKGDDATVLLTNDDQYPARGPAGELIAARGLREVSTGRCPGIEPHRPGLLLELALPVRSAG